MRDWKKNMEILCDPLCRQVQIACHRGKFSSSVMENTALAFQAAVGQGADMVEMDLARTKDGRIVGHHDDTMIRLFHNPGRIGDYTLEELKNMELYNYLGEPCVQSIETFDEILDALRDRTILVLDKCWDCWDEVLELLEREGMTGQAVFKPEQTPGVRRGLRRLKIPAFRGRGGLGKADSPRGGHHPDRLAL